MRTIYIYTMLGVGPGVSIIKLDWRSLKYTGGGGKSGHGIAGGLFQRLARHFGQHER